MADNEDVVMDREAERELDAVISEEKAKVVVGDGYATLPYLEWVEELKNFVTTQRCVDCGAGFNLDEPEEEMWGWFVEGEQEDVEELEVVQFFCDNCLDMTEEEREDEHPKGWGMLIFRRAPTGTFPLDDEEDEDDEFDEEIDLDDDYDLERRDDED